MCCSRLAPIRFVPFSYFADFRLTHLEHQAAHAHAAADVLVDRVRRFGPWHGVAADIYGCV
jgi:hypothetical protein